MKPALVRGAIGEGVMYIRELEKRARGRELLPAEALVTLRHTQSQKTIMMIIKKLIN